MKVLRADGSTVEFEYGGGTLRRAFETPWEPTGFEGDQYKPLAGKSADKRNNLPVVVAKPHKTRRASLRRCVLLLLLPVFRKF